MGYWDLRKHRASITNDLHALAGIAMDIASLITPGTVITLKASRDDAVAEFETSLIEIVGDCLLCEPIMVEGKAVNFKMPGLKTEMSLFDKSEGKMYCWKELEVKLGYYKKKTLCQLVYIRCEPIVINRRANYRQYIGISGKVTYFRSPPKEILIRDVCNNGVGFLSDKKGEYTVGKTVNICFNDEDGRFKFDLKCQIVRERELENGRYEYGCLVNNPPYTLSAYVAHKQIEERKRVLGHI
ncbi:MAG: PilZ domain-containing protein [Lachnospiraceae bacterium]|nr:PilZ domain-containing protein [Lachnospiraceae bacterium]MCR5768694.1 PilZ domain-containing protein [Lachnospiraceae bacterium]